MASLAQTLGQLNSARDIVLRDHTLYPKVVPGVLQVIAPAAQLELRRWGADFLAETFASRAVTADEKQQMSQVVLDTLKGWLERKEVMGEEEDTTVVKSAVQCAASVYPLVFRHTVSNSSDSESWRKMATIKSSILRRMDTASPGVRICCIKFVACVVQTQTPGFITDPRRQEQNEISLALVPRDHAVIPPANLEAEASGLLDRLLGVLQDNPSDALIVTATLNALASLVHRRASISSKILNAVLTFSPLMLAHSPVSTKDKLTIRSMTRTTILFLQNCAKRNPATALAGRIQQQVERLKHGLTEVFSGAMKRPAPDEPIDGLDDAKRQKLNADAANGVTPLQQSKPSPSYAPLPAGPVSLAQLFTLTTDRIVQDFHAERMPVPVLAQLVPAIAAQVPQSKVDEAINVVRSRWLSIGRHAPASAVDAAKAATGDEDDDYDPMFGMHGVNNQSIDRSERLPSGGPVNEVASALFSLPTPAPLDDAEREDYSKTAVHRVFGTLDDMDKEIRAKGRSTSMEHGFNRLATTTSGHDREGWVALITRLATRATLGLPDDDARMKRENGDRMPAKSSGAFDLSSNIREAILTYVMENFRARIDVAIMWLSEEWYSDRLSTKEKQAGGLDVEDDDMPNYWHWTLRLLDAMVPYFDVKDDKVLIRFLSEVPAINSDVLDRLKKVAEDPERIQISTKALLYLIMFRPPVRQLAVDCAEQMYRENQDAKTAAKKILSKWRPAVLEPQSMQDVKVEAT